MNHLREFALSIQKHEGWYPGSRSWRNNSPGNLRYSKFQSGVRDGFAYFKDYETGLAALEWDVKQKCLGNTSTGLGPNSTIEDFFKFFAPSSDGNYPLEYAAGIAREIGISPLSQLREIYSEEIKKPDAMFPQRILVISVNTPDMENSVELARQWFQGLGVASEIETVAIEKKLNFTRAMVQIGTTNTPVESTIVDPEQVKAVAALYEKNHHFVIFAWNADLQSGRQTAFKSDYLGAMIIQLPVMTASTAEYNAEQLCHELMHGWHFRASQVGYNGKDRTHELAWRDTRPEARYDNIVNELRPLIPLMFRMQTKEEKLVGLRSALVGALQLLQNFLTKFYGTNRKTA